MYVRPTSTRLLRGMLTPEIRAIRLPLSLLVSWIRADNEHPPIPADDLALLAHRLDRGSYFHARFALTVGSFSCGPSAGLWRPVRSPLPRRGALAAQNTRAT